MYLQATSIRVFVAALVVAFAVPAARADRPTAAQLLPDETVIYVRMANVPQSMAKFQETAMGRISNDPEIKPLVTHLYGSMTEAFSRVQERVGASLGELLKIPQGEVAFAVVAPEGMSPAVLLLVDVGDQLPSAQKLVEKGEAAIVEGGGVKSTETVGDTLITTYVTNNDANRTIAFCERKGTYIIATRTSELKNALARWDGKEDKELGKPLTQNDKFAAVMKRCQSSASEGAPFVWYADPIAATKAFARGNTSAQVGLAVLPSLGLDGLQAVGGSLIFGIDDFDAVSHTHLLLESPRGGVLKMIALKSGEISPEPWVPADAAGYTTFHWDADETYTELRKVYNSFLGDNALANDVKRTISDPLGADFETEILTAAEGRVSLVNWVEKPAKLNARANLVAIKLKDAKAFTPVLEKVMAKFPEALEPQAYGGVNYWRSKIDPRPRRRNRPAGDAQPAGGDRPAGERPPRDIETVLNVDARPCIAIYDDYLLVADRESILQHCIAAKSEGGKGLAGELDYKLIASKIKRQPGGDTPGLVTFDRPEEGLRMLYDVATAEATKQSLGRAAERNDFFKAIDGALKDKPLPPFAVIAKYLAPSGGMVTTDETGFHYTGFVLKRK